MPDLLNPTNPVPKYDTTTARNMSTVQNNNNPNIQNVVDPGRVVRPDGRTEQQDAGDAAASQKMRYESNFLTFLQRLRESPDLSESFIRLIQGQGLQISSGISEGIAAELQAFLELIKMDESRLLSFLQNQLKSEARFSGPLFQALRTAFQGSQSEVLRTEILQFLRQFSDYSSTARLEKNILRLLQDMSQSMPSRWGDQLTTMSALFENGSAAGDRQGNLQLLRQQVFPLIADYVRQTHDHGRARALLSLLALDMIRYENGDPQQLAHSFRHLNRYGIFPADFGGLSDKELLQLLKSSDFLKASKSDAFADHLAALADRALRGEGGVNAQEAFRNIMASILINESVYMPLRHLMLPFDWNGKAVYSEMWIDPDAGGNAQGQGGGNLMRILIKMDIQDLGAFDLLIASQSGKTSLHLACPPAIAGFSGEIAGQLSSILERNGLKTGDINVTAMKRPLTISEAFPELFSKGVNGVDVKI